MREDITTPTTTLKKLQTSEAVVGETVYTTAVQQLQALWQKELDSLDILATVYQRGCERLSGKYRKILEEKPDAVGKKLVHLVEDLFFSKTMTPSIKQILLRNYF